MSSPCGCRPRCRAPALLMMRAARARAAAVAAEAGGGGGGGARGRWWLVVLQWLLLSEAAAERAAADSNKKNKQKLNVVTSMHRCPRPHQQGRRRAPRHHCRSRGGGVARAPPFVGAERMCVAVVVYCISSRGRPSYSQSRAKKGGRRTQQ